jgi:hypothetical protein
MSQKIGKRRIGPTYGAGLQAFQNSGLTNLILVKIPTR